jgi:hypothetical protein
MMERGQSMRNFLKLPPVGLMVTLFIFGCASGPTPEQLRSADYGEYPSTDTLRQAVKSRIAYSYTMRDFEVVRESIPTWCEPVGKEVVFGYATLVRFTSRTEKGPREKPITYFLFTRNGEVIRFGKYDPYLHDRFWENESTQP